MPAVPLSAVVGTSVGNRAIRSAESRACTLQASASQAEEARRLIAQASDLGVTSHERNVVRFALGEQIEEIGQ